MGEKKKKKLSTSGMSAKEKMMARKKKLSEKGNGSNLIFLKEGTVRVRIKSPGPDEEIGMEIIYFYDPKSKRSIYSPATFGEPCPVMEKYEQLKNSRDDDDKALAKQFVPKRKYVIAGGIYSDPKGKTLDEETLDKGILIPTGVYQDLIDLYLDEDDWGDMTGKDGYDVKINRSGSGKNDTSYSVSACPRTKLIDKRLATEVDLEKIVRNCIPSYEELEEKLAEMLNGVGFDGDDDDDDRPKKKKKDKGDKKDKKKKKKSRGEDDDLPF